MWIEACEPLSIRLSTGVIELDPGQPVELTDAVAAKLLQRVPGKVRRLVLLGPQALVPGTRILWRSPLFGSCTGEVVLASEGGWVVVREHSITGRLALVPTMQVWGEEPE